jgi:23S rRNA (pseudouridine1915-N3)-methyltransferase
MKVILKAIGKTDEKWLVENISKYEKKLKHYFPFTYEEIIIKYKQPNDVLMVKSQEADVLLSQIRLQSDYVILLDEVGTMYSSTDFAQFLSHKYSSSGIQGNLIFIIGGAFGFDEKIYQIANEKISLSKMTFTHQMVRLFAIEQLFRAGTILKGEKYHH